MRRNPTIGLRHAREAETGPYPEPFSRQGAKLAKNTLDPFSHGGDPSSPRIPNTGEISKPAAAGFDISPVCLEDPIQPWITGLFDPAERFRRVRTQRFTANSPRLLSVSFQQVGKCRTASRGAGRRSAFPGFGGILGELGSTPWENGFKDRAS